MFNFLFKKRKEEENNENENMTESIVLCHVDLYYGKNDIMLSLSKKLTKRFIEEYPDAIILENKNMNIVFVGWDILIKYNKYISNEELK